MSVLPPLRRHRLGGSGDEMNFATTKDTDDGDVRVCPESGDCVTEYCLPCYARAALKEE